MSENGLGALHSSNALPVQDDEHKKAQIRWLWIS